MANGNGSAAASGGEDARHVSAIDDSLAINPGYIWPLAIFARRKSGGVNTDLDSTFFGNDMRLANLSPNSVPLLKTDPGCGIKMQIRGFGRGATEWSESYFLQNVPSVHLSKKGG